MSVIDREVATVLDTTRDSYGRTVHHHAATAARARRNHAALEAYAMDLAPRADDLLTAAHRALDELPPSRHTAAWRSLLDSLAAAHAEIVRVLDKPATRGSDAEREQQAGVWPHLAAWADHSPIVADLTALLPHAPECKLTDAERQMWTERAQTAQRRGELDLIESWYAADGRRITLAYLVEDDTSFVVALLGDPDAPTWQVIGHYDNEYAAGQALPRAVPPGVLRADVSRFNRPELVPERSLQELIRDAVEARTAGDASEALLAATQHGYDAGPVIRLQELLDVSGKFADALETAQGQRIAARLATLSRQVDFLAREIHDTAEDLGATVAVLPPHRVPAPQLRPRPALDTTPPAPPPRTTATLRQR